MSSIPINLPTKAQEDPAEALETLGRCYAVIGDLVGIAGTVNGLRSVNAENFTLLLMLLNELHTEAVNANFAAFAKLTEENEALVATSRPTGEEGSRHA